MALPDPTLTADEQAREGEFFRKQVLKFLLETITSPNRNMFGQPLPGGERPSSTRPARPPTNETAPPEPQPFNGSPAPLRNNPFLQILQELLKRIPQ